MNFEFHGHPMLFEWKWILGSSEGKERYVKLTVRSESAKDV